MAMLRHVEDILFQLLKGAFGSCNVFLVSRVDAVQWTLTSPKSISVSAKEDSLALLLARRCPTFGRLRNTLLGRLALLASHRRGHLLHQTSLPPPNLLRNQGRQQVACSNRLRPCRSLLAEDGAEVKAVIVRSFKRRAGSLRCAQCEST